MKKELKYLVLFSLLTLFGCGNEEDAVSGIVPPQAGETLQLSVSAADFVTDGAPDTRATDSGKTTTFEDNDRVGVIILDADNNLIYDNIPYVYKSGSWTFDSNNDEGKGGCYYDTKAETYIVYYPYNHTANGVTSVDDLKDRFAPKLDQSDIKDYRASDLMVWNSKGHLASSVTTLNAELKHAFASVYLAPTVGSYILDDDNSTPYNGSYTPTVSDISDVSLTIDNTVYVPFQASDGSLRCIVPAGITPDDIRCFYTIGGKTYGNTIKISGTGEVVDNTRYACQPEIKNVTYSLGNAHVGDFYCKNSNNEGYLIPGDVILIDDQKTACIGIVFWVGDATAKDHTLKSDYKDCTHGLVVALNNVEGGTSDWQNPHNSVQSWLNNNNKNGVYLSVESGTGSNAPLNNIQGYNNTKAIEEFNLANSGNLVQAVVEVVEYRNAVPAPNNSSKWYLPSEKELTLLCGREDVDNIGSNGSGGTANKDLINGKLSSINSVATQISPAPYWSSTEFSDFYAFYVDFNNGRVNGHPKSNYPCRVRCVLAF